MNVSGQVCLRRGEESRVRGGAPWIFENELDWADDTCEKGGLVDVLDSRLRFAARGFWNPDSKICVRVLTRDADETIDREFFRRRLLRAWGIPPEPRLCGFLPRRVRRIGRPARPDGR